MMDWIKKQGIATYAAAASVVLLLVAMIVYIVNSVTGYMASVSMNALPIVFTLISIVLLGVLIVIPDKLNHWIVSAIFMVIVVLLTVSLALFITGRTDVAGDQWFIPGLDTAEKAACLNGAIVGVVFYALSIIAVIAAGFFGKFRKA